MDKVKFTGIAGRKPRYVQLDDGDMVIVKKMFKIGNGYAILLPTEWLALLDSKGLLEKGEYQFTLWYDTEKLIIEPLKAEILGRVN